MDHIYGIASIFSLLISVYTLKEIVSIKVQINSKTKITDNSNSPKIKKNKVKGDLVGKNKIG